MSFKLAHQGKNKTVRDSKTSMHAKHISSAYHSHINNLNRDSQDSIFQLQQAIGNQAVQRRLQFRSGLDFAKIGIQPKLKVSQPGDAYEQEADRVAEQVMRIPISSDSVVSKATSKDEGVDRKCGAGEMKEKKEDEKQLNISRKPATVSNPEANDEIADEIDNIRSSSDGTSLDANTREFMESSFGYDFSKVRVHNGENAARSAKSVNAVAYTIGNDIMFGEGHYQPNTLEGRRLLAHELTHVVQQNVMSMKIGRHKSDSPMISLFQHSPTVDRQISAGDAVVKLEEEDKQPMDLDYSIAAAIGNEALQTFGYEEIINLATKAGLLERRTQSTETLIERKSDGYDDRIFRQAEAATFGGVFTRYAVAAGIASQVDSPAPGPGDVIALGILVAGLAAATYTVLSRDSCDIQLVNCLENVWQPDWNKEDFGPRKDCGACHRECKHAGGRWPYYKCPA